MDSYTQNRDVAGCCIPVCTCRKSAKIFFTFRSPFQQNRRLLSSNRMPSSIAEQLVESMWPSQILQALMHCTHLEFPKLWDVVAEAYLGDFRATVRATTEARA